MNLKETESQNIAAGLFSGGIEAQEKRGQDIFVASDILPVNMMYGCSIEKLKFLGVKFKEILSDDNIFIECRFPEGWRKVLTDHSMWSNLVNENDEIVANIF